MKKPIKDVCPYYVKGDSGCYYHLPEGLCRKSEFFRCPVYDYLFTPKISVSELNTFMKCKRSYFCKYIWGIEVLPKMMPKPMKIGKLIHTGVEQIYKTGEYNLEKEFSEYFNQDEDKEIGTIRLMLNKFKTFNRPEEGQAENRFEISLPDCPKITGVIDILLPDGFIEVKATGNPDYHLTPHFLQSQLATYFLSNENLKYCVMQIIRIPQLRSAGGYKGEEDGKYLDRLSVNINKRPGFYFMGLDKESNGFGKKFYRSEFNLTEVIERYKFIVKEKRLCIENDMWYKNETQCLYPVQCVYLPACETGGFSELIYKKREKKISD